MEGEAIPMAARIFTVADVFDALVSKRVYKAAFTHVIACNLVLKGSGTQFNPNVIHAFLRCQSQFQAISESMAD